MFEYLENRLKPIQIFIIKLYTVHKYFIDKYFEITLHKVFVTFKLHHTTNPYKTIEYVVLFVTNTRRACLRKLICG